MEAERHSEINRRWLPLTYGCIAYSALTLVYLIS
jgi:hypothetical protein